MGILLFGIQGQALSRQTAQGLGSAIKAWAVQGLDSASLSSARPGQCKAFKVEGLNSARPGQCKA